MLIGLSVLIFILACVILGRSARLALGPRTTDKTTRQFRHQMRLDQPIWLQYISYMTGLLRGGLGQPLIPNYNVATDLVQYLPAILELTTVAMLIAIAVSVPLGVTSGQHEDAALDNLSRLFSLFNVSLPPSWAGILLQLIIAFGLGWFPATGRTDDASPIPITVTDLLLVDSAPAQNIDAFISAAQYLALPALALSLTSMADIARMTHSSFIEECDKDHVESLQTHGIPDRLIAYKYVPRKSSASTLTIIGLDYGFLLGSVLVVKIAFSWLGMASYGVEAILQKDMNAMVGITLVVGGSFLLVNFLADVLYGFLGPRVWHEGE